MRIPARFAPPRFQRPAVGHHGLHRVSICAFCCTGNPFRISRPMDQKLRNHLASGVSDCRHRGAVGAAHCQPHDGLMAAHNLKPA